MALSLGFDDLLAYTDWDRQNWHEFFRKNGEAALKVSAGPHGDGRMTTIGDVVKHIFGAEIRYVDRLCERPITDWSAMAAEGTEALFDLGKKSRASLRHLLATFPADQWDVAHEFKILTYQLNATPKKIVTHVLMHEIRHWAQAATILRIAGYKVEFRDFLFAPVLSGERGVGSGA